jgi:hypothetical protein
MTTTTAINFRADLYHTTLALLAYCAVKEDQDHLIALNVILAQELNLANDIPIWVMEKRRPGQGHLG